ncbi:MAG: flippase-like domain-containing protein [Bacteroidia bacterium]|nr:flippase-like domain-containing protein [Bacteroidia bacterium]
MKRGKKILSFLLKLSIGAAGVYIIYRRLKNELGWEQISLLKNALLQPSSLLLLVISLFLIPLNWGLESRKWQLITKSIESISFKTAIRSVFSGVCLGNFAPGRATEFLGKILFFSDENKGKISVLHFVNGMIQLGITLLVGVLALLLKLETFSKEYFWLFYLLLTSALVLLGVFMFSVLRVNLFLNLVSKLLSRKSQTETIRVVFPKSLWLKLLLLSLLRYLTFSLQFFLLLTIFSPSVQPSALLPGIALYFMMTSLLPMISVLEAAIRAAIALIVLGDTGLSSTLLALATVMLWLFNIVLPSLIGYLVLLRLKFDFKLIYKRNK